MTGYFADVPDAPICLRSPCEQPDLIMLSPDQSEAFAFPTTTNPGFYRLQVLVSETRGEDAFLTFLAEVFGAASDDIKTELRTSLITSLVEESAEKELQEIEKVRIAYDEALVVAFKALQTCGASGAAADAAAARVSIQKLNQAARLVPNSSLASVAVNSSNYPAETVKEECQERLEQLLN